MWGCYMCTCVSMVIQHMHGYWAWGLVVNPCSFVSPRICRAIFGIPEPSWRLLSSCCHNVGQGVVVAALRYGIEFLRIYIYFLLYVLYPKPRCANRYPILLLQLEFISSSISFSSTLPSVSLWYLFLKLLIQDQIWYIYICASSLSLIRAHAEREHFVLTMDRVRNAFYISPLSWFF